jgi:hypothetical protein
MLAHELIAHFPSEGQVESAIPPQLAEDDSAQPKRQSRLMRLDHHAGPFQDRLHEITDWPEHSRATPEEAGHRGPGRPRCWFPPWWFMQAKGTVAVCDGRIHESLERQSNKRANRRQQRPERPGGPGTGLISVPLDLRLGRADPRQAGFPPVKPAPQNGSAVSAGKRSVSCSALPGEMRFLNS